MYSMTSSLGSSFRQQESVRQRDEVQLELVALKKSMAAGPARQPPGRRGSQVMFMTPSGAGPRSPEQQSSAAAEANADRLSAMSEKIKQQVCCLQRGTFPRIKPSAYQSKDHHQQRDCFAMQRSPAACLSFAFLHEPFLTCLSDITT